MSMMIRQRTKRRPFGATSMVRLYRLASNLIMHKRELINKSNILAGEGLEWREEEDCKPFAKTFLVLVHTRNKLHLQYT